MKKFWCSSGMEMQVSVVLALTMVAQLRHPHLTHYPLTLLLQQIRKMMKMVKKVKTMSEAS
jgi:hypothetical protein